MDRQTDMERQTDRQVDRQTDRHLDRRTQRQTGGQIGRWTDWQIDVRQTDRQNGHRDGSKNRTKQSVSIAGDYKLFSRRVMYWILIHFSPYFVSAWTMPFKRNWNATGVGCGLERIGKRSRFKNGTYTSWWRYDFPRAFILVFLEHTQSPWSPIREDVVSCRPIKNIGSEKPPV